MSGHSKWSKIKHQKATTDVAKAAAFTRASHAITIAVREGGGVTDPEGNFHLRLAIEKARQVNMPKENIERIISKASGTSGGDIAKVMYEAYGPGGIALLIEAATDNPNRTVSVIKNILEHSGGTMVAQGALSYQFSRSGIIVVPKNNITYDRIFALAAEAGANDVVETTGSYDIYTDMHVLNKVKNYLEQKGMSIEMTDLIMKAHTPVSASETVRARIDTLCTQLQEHEDVTRVYTTLT